MAASCAFAPIATPIYLPASRGRLPTTVGTKPGPRTHHVRVARRCGWSLGVQGLVVALRGWAAAQADARVCRGGGADRRGGPAQRAGGGDRDRFRCGGD